MAYVLPLAVMVAGPYLQVQIALIICVSIFNTPLPLYHVDYHSPPPQYSTETTTRGFFYVGEFHVSFQWLSAFHFKIKIPTS